MQRSAGNFILNEEGFNGGSYSFGPANLLSAGKSTVMSALATLLRLHSQRLLTH
jgi:hypothetical protein